MRVSNEKDTVIQCNNQTNCINFTFQIELVLILFPLPSVCFFLFLSRSHSTHSTMLMLFYLVFIFRYGANVIPKDGGMMPIVAILDKLVESPEYTEIHVETCLKILLKTVPNIEMPYKVSK